MTGGNEVVVAAPLLVKRPELYQSVAHHVGIGREARTHLVHRVARHAVPILLVTVHHLKPAAVARRHCRSHFKVFLTRTVPFGLFFRPYLYIEAIGLEATTRQFVHHHRAVHSSREQHGYLLFHNIVCCIHIIKTSICTYDCMKRHDEKT